MIYRFYDDVPDNTLNFVESIIPLIGNIKEFEVFRDRNKSPYVIEENGQKIYYTFVLMDDNGNEIWLHTLCGYSGSGPYTTLKILQLLGINEDFGLTNKENDHIIKKNIQPLHKLDLVVTIDNSQMLDKKVLDYLFYANIDFQYAHQKYRTIKILELLGYLQHAKLQNKSLFEKVFLLDDLMTPATETYYFSNYIFSLDKEFCTFSRGEIQILIERIIRRSGGTLNELNIIKDECTVKIV